MTEGEDSFFQGANAFVAEYPWMKDVRVAINIDGIQQVRIPLLETSANNGWLIEEFARPSGRHSFVQRFYLG
ncbi:MAG TPA: M28 family peptidase [Anaerolineaceae bacterium]